MTQFKHTPGPWRTDIRKERDGDFTPYFDVMSSDQNMKHVCSCCNYGWLGDEGLDTAEANAKLIAAAPELLEALKDLLKQIEDVGGNCTVIYLNTTKSYSAIKKATE